MGFQEGIIVLNENTQVLPLICSIPFIWGFGAERAEAGETQRCCRNNRLRITARETGGTEDDLGFSAGAVFSPLDLRILSCSVQLLLPQTERRLQVKVFHMESVIY